MDVQQTLLPSRMPFLMDSDLVTYGENRVTQNTYTTSCMMHLQDIKRNVYLQSNKVLHMLLNGGKIHLQFKVVVEGHHKKYGCAITTGTNHL